MKVTDLETFDSIAVSIASPETMLSWSHGEVKKPETINYRTQKPERDGLFCERIFGPTKNWECYCGKYKRVRYKGVICEKCGVEVTRSSVRRERMGHIKLAVPVTHIWYVRSTPSRIGLLTDLPIKTLEQVIYFAAYIVTEVDEKTKTETKETLQKEYRSMRQKIQDEFKEKSRESKGVPEVEKEYLKKLNELDGQHEAARRQLQEIRVCQVYSELEYRDVAVRFGHMFKAGMGAEAIREILEKIDPTKLIELLQEDLKKASGQRQKKLMKRIKLLGSLSKAGIRPEWTAITVLPVIPPDLRPMVQLDGGRFATSDLNDLYRRVINRNNRLKRLISIGAPEVITRNEKRMMQEAIDTLFNNSARTGRTVFSSGDKRKLRSLSDMLKGKQGRFRQNLLGKRVDYSGRSVIVVGPKLKMHQCGLPKLMALELFKPFVIGRLIRDGYATNIKSAEKLIQTSKKEVWDILEDVTKNHYVLLNRAPTLHRLGIQAFQPVLVEGKAIQLHPLVCPAFNADFDGDQMAVHVPLSRQAQREAQELIVSTHNLLKPSAGEPIMTPIQDMVLGCYYLTKMTPGKMGAGMTFASLEEAMLAYNLDYLHIQAPIKARWNGSLIETTLGRLIFNSVIPEKLQYINENVDKKKLNEIVAESFEKYGMAITALLGDALKRLGFMFATKSGLSVAASDMIIPPEKYVIIEEASEVVKKINNQYWKGLITDEERYLHTIKVWSQAKSDITNFMVKKIEEENPLHYMIASGARGNWGQITQLCGMKGLVANPAGRTIELPIKSNLKEGFTILEYFIATHGGRKGKSDTALKTAEAGYLTRRLVDAVQDIVVREYDCGSDFAHRVTRRDSEMIGEKFEARVFGRTLAVDLISPKTGELLAPKGYEIDKALVQKIRSEGVLEMDVRSVLTCKSAGGVCVKCYGKDLGNNQMVDIGVPIGIIAAQSIGEPGTQLTMRTFHMGGVAEAGGITQGLTRVEELFEARAPKAPAVLAEIPGKARLHSHEHTMEITIHSEKPIERDYFLGTDATAAVKIKDRITQGSPLAKSETQKAILKAEESGVVTAVTDDRITVLTDVPVTKVYKIPFGKMMKIKDGAIVKKGDALTMGHCNLRELLRLTDVYTVLKYIMMEVQSVYASQGQTINDKHIEIIARQMLSKTRVIDPGESTILPGEIIDFIELEQLNAELAKEKKKPVKAERLLLGLTRVSLYTKSWLSAASFQETIRVLVEASTTKRIDELEGLKENVIIGKLIPAGETYRRRKGAAVRERMEKREAQEQKDIHPKIEAASPEYVEQYRNRNELHPIV